jgi:hypothetical protein
MIVLAALAARPAHGYAVIEQIKIERGQAFDLPEGTIYPIFAPRPKLVLNGSQPPPDEVRRQMASRPALPTASHGLAERRHGGS